MLQMKCFVFIFICLLFCSDTSTSLESSNETKNNNGLTKSGLLNNLSSNTNNLAKTSTTFNTYLIRFQNLKFPVSNSKTEDKWYGDIEGGQTRFMNKHIVNCGIGAISQFQYSHNKTGRRWRRYHYKFRCIKPPSGCTGVCRKNITKLDKAYCKIKKTPWNILKNWNSFSTGDLAKHNIQCKGRSVLTMFRQVNGKSKKRIRFIYRCCPAKVTGCKFVNTKPTPFGNFKTDYLMKQIVKVPNVKKQAMSGFRLKVNYTSRKWYYRIRYCSIQGR